MKQTEYPVTALRILVDSIEENSDNITGSIIGVALKDSYSFSGVPSLLLLIDRLLDQIGKPQPSRQSRSFNEEGEKTAKFVGNPKRYHSSEEIRQSRGKLKTLDVYFVSRARSSWQGFVKDENGEMEGSFESDVEFIKMALYDRFVTEEAHNKY